MTRVSLATALVLAAVGAAAGESLLLSLVTPSPPGVGEPCWLSSGSGSGDSSSRGLASCTFGTGRVGAG